MYTHQQLDIANGAALRTFAKETGFKGYSKLKANELRQALRDRLPPRVGTSPPLFVELCAGTAALSLRLHQEGANPPVSRMGSKRGYANAILHELGLYPGLQAGHYLWCEPDAGCRLLLEAYRDEKLAKAAAAIIRSWKDEEPRALWERLRAEGPAKCPPADVREVARWSFVQSSNTFIALDENFRNTGAGGSTFYDRDDPCRAAPLIDNTPTLPATIAPDARTVDAREVARWALLPAWDVKGTGTGFFRGPAGVSSGVHSRRALTIDGASARFATLSTLPASIAHDATQVEPPTLPPGTVAYIDPPYVGTTGYGHDLGRKQVIELALRWHEAGAMVAISEQEAIPELLALGWRAVDITSRRDGQKRTFSKQKTEFLTLSPDQR